MVYGNQILPKEVLSLRSEGYLRRRSCGPRPSWPSIIPWFWIELDEDQSLHFAASSCSSCRIAIVSPWERFCSCTTATTATRRRPGIRPSDRCCRAGRGPRFLRLSSPSTTSTLCRLGAARRGGRTIDGLSDDDQFRRGLQVRGHGRNSLATTNLRKEERNDRPANARRADNSRDARAGLVRATFQGPWVHAPRRADESLVRRTAGGLAPARCGATRTAGSLPAGSCGRCR